VGKNGQDESLCFGDPGRRPALAALILTASFAYSSEEAAEILGGKASSVRVPTIRARELQFIAGAWRRDDITMLILTRRGAYLDLANSLPKAFMNSEIEGGEER
jgi:hypothetical protein